MTNQGARSGASHFFLILLRIGAGLVFMEYGVQKLFGWLGYPRAAVFPQLYWFAGMLETWGGLAIVLGLCTRGVAFVLACEMLVAYSRAHLPISLFPVVNRGQPAVLFFLIYAFLAANGGGSFSLDGLLSLRRRGRPAE